MAELTRDELLELVDECLHADVSRWEEGFLESVQDKLDRGRSLSEYEAEKVQQIWRAKW